MSHSRRKSRGVVLPIVLLLSSMLLVTAAAWFEMDLARARATANSIDRIIAFHAADSALIRCSQLSVIGAPPMDSTALLATEPAGWRSKSSFDLASGQALTPFSSWPHSARAPQCLIEPWPSASSSNASAFLITARGFGGAKASEVWLQEQVTVVHGAWSRRWRRIVARPFQSQDTSP
jgi:Tfp pilus assembly protein PilX